MSLSNNPHYFLNPQHLPNLTLNIIRLQPPNPHLSSLPPHHVINKQPNHKKTVQSPVTHPTITKITTIKNIHQAFKQ